MTTITEATDLLQRVLGQTWNLQTTMEQFYNRTVAWKLSSAERTYYGRLLQSFRRRFWLLVSEARMKRGVQ